MSSTPPPTHTGLRRNALGVPAGGIGYGLYLRRRRPAVYAGLTADFEKTDQVGTPNT